MKKIIFGILFFFSLLLAVQIFHIVVNDLDRLTDYGYGYLAGKIILFSLLLSGSIYIGMKIHKNSLTKNK